MQSAASPTISSIAANDQWYVRFYLCLAVIVLATGLLIIVGSSLFFSKPGDAYQDLLQKVAGVVISFLSALPIKELLNRRDQLRRLRALEAYAAELEKRTDVTQEHVERVKTLLWDMYRKVIAES